MPAALAQFSSEASTRPSLSSVLVAMQLARRSYISHTFGHQVGISLNPSHTTGKRSPDSLLATLTVNTILLLELCPVDNEHLFYKFTPKCP
jgi:hypothetical protein